MRNIAKGLIGLAAAAFVLAVVDSAITGPIMLIPAESFSRASTNLALLAIGLLLAFRDESGNP